MTKLPTSTPQATEATQTRRYQESMTDDGRYRLLVEGISDYAIYMLSPEGLVTSWNRGAQLFKGYTAEEIMGSHFSEFYTPEDKASGLPARALHTAATAGKFESEGWRVRKDGRRFWAYVVIDPIRAPSGELIGFAKITRDLTERRAAEELLRTSQEQFRLLVQGVTDYAIYMLTPSGVIASWNVGAQRIKGYLAEDVIGTHFSRFYTAEDLARDEPTRALETAEREGRYEKEGLRLRKDGSSFWANVVIDAVRNDAGKLIGFAKVTRDITTQRDTRLALERARESLFHAQKMDAIGQLTGGVAHDFNNLLTAILGSLDLLRKRLPDDPKARALLENAILGAQRGSALTQRMLAFARRQELHVEAIDIPTLVKGMSDLIDRSLGSVANVEFRFPPQLAAVLTDANQLELALLNLVVNARDALSGGGSIIVTAEEELISSGNTAGLNAGRYVCVSVTDSGEGMDEVTLSRAMEPFFTTKGVGKGTGLGLPMAHGLAEQSGGRLLLKSEKGRGTTAELWLPAADQAPTRPTPAPELVPTLSRPLTVLAVDDDALVLSSTIAMLEDLGHTVFDSASAAHALTVLREKAVDLVITDHAMPGMTGAKLAEIIASRHPGLPIIIATGFAELPEGMAGHLLKLPKPFDQHELSRAISAAVTAASTGPTTPAADS